MSELTEVNGHPVLYEQYYQIGELPIMVCVLIFAGDFYVIGFSLSKPRMFDEEIARALAKRNAKMNAVKMLAGRRPVARAAE